MMMAVWKFAPTIAAGNTVVLKPAPTTPVSTLLLAEIASEWLPPGVFNVVCGGTRHGPGAGGASRAPDGVDHRQCPGRARGGLGGGPGPQVCAPGTGGKAPVVVFDDADVEKAAEAIAIAGYFNAGQDCTAATRVLAGPEVYDDFTAALVQQAQGQTVAGPDVEGADFGPLNNTDQLARVRGFIDTLPAHATLRTGGHQIGDRGYFYEPTVVSDVVQSDDIV